MDQMNTFDGSLYSVQSRSPTSMSISPPLPGFAGLAIVKLRGRGSDGASIWLSWKSPCPLMCTSLSTLNGRPRMYPDTERVPRPLGPPPATSAELLGVNVTCWAKRWERLVRKPSFLCLWLPRCLRRRVASCSESRGKRRASGKRTSAIFDRALLASTLFFTGRSDTPWHTRASWDENKSVNINTDLHLCLKSTQTYPTVSGQWILAMCLCLYLPWLGRPWEKRQERQYSPWLSQPSVLSSTNTRLSATFATSSKECISAVQRNQQRNMRKNIILKNTIHNIQEKDKLM